MTHRFFSIAASAALFLFTVTPICRAAGKDISGSLRSGTLERTYHVHLPPQYNGKQALPLISRCMAGEGTAERMALRPG